MEFYLGMIILFGGNFQIKGWAFCAGQLLSIAQNQALFSILGTIYGGNGQTTFALPDLRGRMPIGWGPGAGPGLSNYTIGQMSGVENVTLLIPNMPAHNHVAMTNGMSVTPSASTAAGTSKTPAADLVPATLPSVGSGPGAVPVNAYAPQDNTAALAPSPVTGNITIGMTGGTQPVNIMNPYLAITYLIATQGIFPSRN